MSHQSPQAPKNTDEGPQLVNVPNALCLIRLVGAAVMSVVAILQLPDLFLILFLVTAFTDWIDGKLAKWLHQRTAFGARLDSVADAAMYAALLFGCIWLQGELIRAQWPWIGAALATYATALTAGLVKFKQWPSYHTYSAKFAWLAIVVAAVALLAGQLAWPLRFAMTAVSLANIESLLITWVRQDYRVDIPTLWYARRC